MRSVCSRGTPPVRGRSAPGSRSRPIRPRSRAHSPAAGRPAGRPRRRPAGVRRRAPRVHRTRPVPRACRRRRTRAPRARKGTARARMRASSRRRPRHRDPRRVSPRRSRERSAHRRGGLPVAGRRGRRTTGRSRSREPARAARSSGPRRGRRPRSTDRPELARCARARAGRVPPRGASVSARPRLSPTRARGPRGTVQQQRRRPGAAVVGAAEAHPGAFARVPPNVHGPPRYEPFAVSERSCDVLVIGSGVAGLTAALSAAGAARGPAGDEARAGLVQHGQGPGRHPGGVRR